MFGGLLGILLRQHGAVTKTGSGMESYGEKRKSGKFGYNHEWFNGTRPDPGTSPEGSKRKYTFFAEAMTKRSDFILYHSTNNITPSPLSQSTGSAVLSEIDFSKTRPSPSGPAMIKRV